MSRGKDALKLMAGWVAERALPGLGREIDECRNTARAPRLKRAILYSRLRRAQSRGDIAAIENALAAFWKGNSGDEFHDHYADARLNLFLEHHSKVIDALAGVLEKSGARFSRLVEIGCGDGSVLAWCAERLPDISEAIGLDINAAVIERISAKQPAGKFSFVNAEARDWLVANPRSGTVMLSNGGVLEYFSQDNLDRLLQALASSPSAAIVLIEPVAPGHDLQSNAGSFAFGRENSFSHNHRCRLEDAGFDVVFGEEMQISNTRWMLMIGVIE
jgi:predicted TPR repeat methyltransferase